MSNNLIYNLKKLCFVFCVLTKVGKITARIFSDQIDVEKF